jgi:hypothetical protein
VFPGSSIRDNPNRSDAFNWLPEDLDGETALLFRIALAPFAGSADADEGFSSGNILTAYAESRVFPITQAILGTSESFGKRRATSRAPKPE